MSKLTVIIGEFTIDEQGKFVYISNPFHFKESKCSEEQVKKFFDDMMFSQGYRKETGWKDMILPGFILMYYTDISDPEKYQDIIPEDYRAKPVEFDTFVC